MAKPKAGRVVVIVVEDSADAEDEVSFVCGLHNDVVVHARLFVIVPDQDAIGGVLGFEVYGYVLTPVPSST
jgi:hypothetical protein